MVYRVVIIDNQGNEVVLSEEDGIRSIDGAGDVDINIMAEALDNLKRAYQGGEEDER